MKTLAGPLLMNNLSCMISNIRQLHLSKTIFLGDGVRWYYMYDIYMKFSWNYPIIIHSYSIVFWVYLWCLSNKIYFRGSKDVLRVWCLENDVWVRILYNRLQCCTLLRILNAFIHINRQIFKKLIKGTSQSGLSPHAKPV